MGTRSAVCEPHGDSYRGRYVHWDGYPSGVGMALLVLVERDGLEAVRQTVIHDNLGWSGLHPDEPNNGVLGLGYADGRFIQVPGYGVGYTVKQFDGVTDAAEQWITPGSDWGTEWRYILADDGIWVLQGYGENPTYIATVPYGDPAAMTAAEETAAARYQEA